MCALYSIQHGTSFLIAFLGRSYINIFPKIREAIHDKLEKVPVNVEQQFGPER